MRICSLAILLIVINLTFSYGQGNRICKWISPTSENFQLDSLTVVPESIEFSDSDSISYSYDINEGNMQLENWPEGKDSVQICYQTLPFALHAKFQHRDLTVYDSNALFVDSRNRYNVGLSGREQLFPTEGLSKSGSISRGISFGNTQDVFVNSALNLQLDGKITENINVRAAINDQNIPFQPEGNTQQLQEFDKVFIQFYNENASLTAGDIVLKNKPSEFLRYYKNVQGGHLSTRYTMFENSIAETSAGISVAKGKFTSELIPVREGILGPYKLRGPQNAAFIIVLANSERVYLDGQLLERGFNYDYTIDYNQGEITFTNKVLITAFSRVRVDYEFSDRNYSRTIVSGNHYQDIGRFKVFANYYSEKDNPNRPLTFDLSDQDKVLLSEIGDDLQRAVISGVDSVVYNENLIRYKQVDTLGLEESVYIFSTNPDSAVFDISFSDVGIGNGNYRLTRSTVNGRIYEWLPPVNGIPQGQYEPVIAIPTPSKKQMFTAGTIYTISEFENVFSEVAVSDNDVNLFSKGDASNNKGTAYKGGFKSEGRRLPLLSDYKWKAGFDFEYNEKSFRPVDRYRFIEFDRNWNYVSSDTATLFDDHIANVELGVSDGAQNHLNYKLSYRDRGEDVKGFQHLVGLSQKLGRFHINSNAFVLQATHANRDSDWKKLDASLQYNSRFFVPGYQYSVEQNEMKFKDSDSLLSFAVGLPIPLNYNAHTFFIKSNDTLSTQFNLSHTSREDFQPAGGELIDAAQSETTNFTLATRIKDNHELNLSATYRMLENFSLENQDRKEETIMGRVDWFADLLDDHVRSELTYLVANAQEPRREFVFLKVPTGEGTHTWRDENEDGIQDLNEFYEAINPDERNYAKIFVPTNEFLIAYSSNFNYRLNFTLPRNWRDKGGLKSFMARFSGISAWSIDKKHTDEKASARFLPFANAIDDENLLSIRESFRSTLFYNRSNPQFGMDGGLFISERKELLTNGFDTRKNNEYQLNARTNFSKSYNLRLGGVKGTLYNASDFLTGRNYDINYIELVPEFEWMPTNNFRLTSTYTYSDKENVMASSETEEQATINSFGVEGRFTQVSKRTLNVLVKYINIDFEGDENTPVGYELLEALRPGDNFSWSFNLQQRVAEGLQISINYEGRKSTDRDVIHIGRMQVSALF